MASSKTEGKASGLLLPVSKCLDKFSLCKSEDTLSCLKKLQSVLSTSSVNSLTDTLHMKDNYGDEKLCSIENKIEFFNPQEDVQDWLQNDVKTCLDNGYIKQISREIPEHILPIGVTGSISDISVKSRGPDEVAYNKYEILRTRIPRGFSLMKLEYSDGRTIEHCVIYASKKFSGSVIDEDEFSGLEEENIELLHDKYFLANTGGASNIIAMEKVNGEAAHFTGRFINGEFYLIAGSKNVHLIFQNTQHIDMYTENRYEMAKVIAHAVLQQWFQLDEEKRSILAQFLHLTRTTVICEIMLPSHQHVVNFGSLNQDTLVVVALAPPPEQKASSLTAMPSEATLSFFYKFGFSVASYKVCQPIEIQNHTETIRKDKNTEGVVYYYEDSRGNTIGMVKLKSSWYIHLRALREQASYRHASKKEPKDFIFYKNRSRNRMVSLDTWLHGSEEDQQIWKNISDEWMEWVEKQVTDGNIPSDRFRGNFPILWEKFCEETGIRERSNDLLR